MDKTIPCRSLVRRLLALLAGAFVLSSPVAGLVQAQTNPQPQILFVRLHLSNDVVTLAGTNLQPGRLKPPRDTHRGLLLHYEVKSVTGLILWKAAIDHPSIVNLEYPDPQQPGQLRRKQVRQPAADFTIRVPGLEANDLIEFYEEEPVGSLKSERKFLGRVALKPASK